MSRVRLPIALPGRLMRWAAAVGVACAVLVGLLLGPVTSSHHGSATADSTYRVDAIFDTAKGIIPGQLVKIAGARVGTIKDVVLTPDFKARIQMQVDRRFAPFRKDASCNIQPEGLISERFVQCEPGTPAAGALEPVGDQAATVPVTHTSVPVAITDLFNIFRVPVRQRFSVVIASLGLGLAGRGDDLNAVLRRANPALALTRKALTILGEQKREIAQSIVDVDRISTTLANRPQSVTSFLDEAAKVTRTTADHSDPLEQGVKKLPALLDQAQPTFARLNEVAAAGTPVLRDIRTATPGIVSLVNQIPAFTAAAKPALSHLSTAATTGSRTVTAAKPVVKLLKTFTAAAGPTGRSLNQLLVNLQARGGLENLLSFIYGAASASSRFDSVSHLLPAHILLSSCSQYSETPTPGCSAHYGDATATRKAPAARKAKTTPAKAAPAAPAATSTQAAPATPAPAGTTDGATIQLPGLPPIKLPPIPGVPGALGGSDQSKGSGTARDLLQYLLGS